MPFHRVVGIRCSCKVFCLRTGLLVVSTGQEDALQHQVKTTRALATEQLVLAARAGHFAMRESYLDHKADADVRHL